MAEKFKSTISYDIDFKKLQKKYPEFFWLDEVLKLHGFLEVYDFEYFFRVGYQTDRVLPKEEVRDLFQKLTAELPWIVDCTTRFNCMELGEPKNIIYLFKNTEEK